MVKDNIKEIKTDNAPQAIGPYSQGVSADNLVFVSGQIPIDPTSGSLIRGNIKEQTALVIENIRGILKSSGLDLDSVVKVEVFLKNMDDFSEVNEVYEKKFENKIKPARQVVEVSRLPKDAGIELSCIAYKN